jgi:hypothetical protein
MDDAAFLAAFRAAIDRIPTVEVDLAAPMAVSGFPPDPAPWMKHFRSRHAIRDGYFSAEEAAVLDAVTLDPPEVDFQNRAIEG